MLRYKEQHESSTHFPPPTWRNRKPVSGPLNTPVTLPSSHAASPSPLWSQHSKFCVFLFPCFITSLWIPEQHIVCFVCFWTSYKWNHMQYIFSTCSFHSAVSSCSFSPLFWVVWIHHYYLSILEPMDFWIVASSLLFQMLFCEHSCMCLLVYRPIFKQTNLL